MKLNLPVSGQGITGKNIWRKKMIQRIFDYLLECMFMFVILSVSVLGTLVVGL